MGPSEICTERLRERRAEHARLESRHQQLGNARLVGVALGLALLWWIESAVPAWTWPAGLGMLAAVLGSIFVFSRIEDSMSYLQHACTLYPDPAQGGRRQQPPTRTIEALSLEVDHAFARDVDVLEPRGLFDRLSLAATREGMKELVRMLTTSVTAETMRERQAAVKELKAQLDLREQFYVAGAQKVPTIRTDHMLAWATQDSVDVAPWVRQLCFVLSCGVIVVGAVAAVSLTPLVILAISALLALEIGVWALFRRNLRLPSLEAERIHLDFLALSELLKILENQDFHSSRLRELVAALRGDGHSATDLIGQYSRLISLYEARNNQIVALLGPLVLYETQLAFAMERWRAKHASRLPGWIAAVAKFEAYSSLACFAFEHPYHAFPDIQDEGLLLRAKSLAHPLLPEDAIANDVRLDPERPILIVSGANMAGKSTLLRTIGISVSLAYAGAPVRAVSMTMSPLHVIASIRTTDSLERGESRFSAELKRIRLMLESMRDGMPTLVLIDELFGGTNSYDRYTGAVALTDFILDSDNCLAVLSTHDRNVTHWAEENRALVCNAHFMDVFEDGRMTFDYTLRKGPAQRGNAVQLMKEAGIPVREMPHPQG